MAESVMYAFLCAFMLGQCGPNGCSIAPGWSQATSNYTALQVEVVPSDGQVWFNDHAVRLLNGKGRVQTPPLEPGRRYRYRVTARWGDVERQWTLSFSPGQTVRVVLQRDEATPSGTIAGTSGASAASPSPPASTELAQPSLSSPPSTAPPKPSSPVPDSADRPGPRDGHGAAPAPKPEGQLSVVEQDGVQNFGINRSGLNGSAERITLDGREISRVEATRILQAGSLADDSGKLRLTVIGTESDRRRVLDDLKGPLTDIAGQCLVQDYPPDHWAVANVGFYTAGKPTIYVQAPDGEVLHRQDDYADGAAGFRQAFERLRKPDPNYRPDKDRDLRRPTGGLLSWLIDILTRPFRAILSWFLAAGVVFVLIVLVMKGWLFYLLGLLANLVPGPPAQARTAGTAQGQAVKKRPAGNRPSSRA